MFCQYEIGDKARDKVVYVTAVFDTSNFMVRDYVRAQGLILWPNQQIVCEDDARIRELRSFAARFCSGTYVDDRRQAKTVLPEISELNFKDYVRAIMTICKAAEWKQVTSDIQAAFDSYLSAKSDGVKVLETHRAKPLCECPLCMGEEGADKEECLFQTDLARNLARFSPDILAEWWDRPFWLFSMSLRQSSEVNAVSTAVAEKEYSDGRVGMVKQNRRRA